MIDFTENPINIGGSTSDSISPGRGKIKIRLALKDGIERLVLILINVFYFPNNLSNLVNLGFLNDAGIYHYNKDQTLYNPETQKNLAFAKQYKTSFLLHPFNLSVAVVNLFKNNEIYKEETPNMNQTIDNKLSLIRRYQRLGHLNFTSLRKHLAHHNIVFIDDTEGYVYNSCKKVTATKRYNQTPQQRATKPY